MILILKNKLRLKKLFYLPNYLVINQYLNENSKNDSELAIKTKELIDEGSIANLFTIYAQNILNETKLAFNEGIKKEITKKIKNDKIIQNINYKN